MSETKLRRNLSLLQATTINMIDMVGIGPFITLPMVIGIMNGPWFLYAWIAGCILSFVDAFIWSELGSALPKAGGSYNFLKEAYGPEGAGKYVSFLFVWQTIFQAPLVIASASIGFSAYLSYLLPMGTFEMKAVSGLMVLAIIALLYRRIESVGKISVAFGVIVVATIVWICVSGFLFGDITRPVKQINEGLHFDKGFMVALGYASVKSVYSYLGYYNVCHLGSEIKQPERNIPRSMFISIFFIATLYLMMNISITSVVPWQEAMHSDFVISLFMERIFGAGAAKAVTVLILIIAFSSVFSATLGYSRIPYAAALDGSFFKIFARVHPTRQFPHISLLFIGGVAFIFSLLFKLTEVISAILAMRIIVQFMGQAIGLLMIHKKGLLKLPYRMPLFPVPIIIGLVMWLAVLLSTGRFMVLTGLGALLTGSLVYLFLARNKKVWPFVKNR